MWCLRRCIRPRCNIAQLAGQQSPSVSESSSVDLNRDLITGCLLMVLLLLSYFKASDTLESDFRKKTCTCVMKTFAIFLLSKQTFTIRTCSILEKFFRKLLSKATWKENFLVCHYLKSVTNLQLLFRHYRQLKL